MDNQDLDDKVVEDTPRLRSVAIGALPQAHHHGISFDSPVSFPSAKPFAATSRVEGAKLSRPAKAAAPQKGWPAVAVEPLPAYYCLERTHALIPGCTVELLAERIAECFRTESFSATFSGNEAVAETSDCVSFSVRLWSDRDDHESRTVIVEVQRISGCGYVYQQAARSVLRACKGELPLAEGTSTADNPVFKLPSCLPEETPGERENCIQQSLEVAQALLNERKMDAQLLALESLVMVSGSCPAARACAARRIVSNDYTFWATLKSLIECGRLAADERDVRPTSDLEVEHVATLRRHALHILANCVAALGEAGEFDRADNPYSPALCSDDRLTAALVQLVADCESCPHNASLALRCLCSLCRYHRGVCAKVHGALQDKGGEGCVLAAAQQYGSRRHAQLLEQATAMNLQLQQQHRDR